MARNQRKIALEAFAKAGHHTSPIESRGLCFEATLELGREARRLGLSEHTKLIRWRVRDDVHYLEHWALMLEDGRILDMTAVQVDGDPQPLRRLRDYPRNYVGPRCYPVEVVLQVIDRAPPPPGAHYPRRLLWALHRRLFRHDLAAAVRRLSVPGMLAVACALLHTGATLWMGYLLERAIARMSRLLMKLD